MPPRARRAARPLERAATPGAEKKQAGKPKAGAQFDGSRPRTGRVLTRPRRSSRSGRCLWPGAPPACRTRTFRWTTSVPTRSHARSTDPSSNQKESLRPFAQRQISRSPTGPSRAFLSRCERFRRPSSCAPVCEGMRDVRGGARGNTRGCPGRIIPQSRGVPTRGGSNK